ncbi:27190_t:CDS:2, partial [Racocetra persica]
KFDEFIELFISEMKQIEKGKIMDVERSESLVIASLGDVIADLHKAMIWLELNDMVLQEDVILVIQQKILRHQTISISAPTITRCKEIAAEYGLRIKSLILDELKREKYLQSPHDIYHVIASKVLRFLKITINTLSSEEKLAFIVVWKSFDYPKNWQKLPNPISHIDSFMMSDCLQLAMIVPFIFNRLLKPQHFKKTDLTLFQQQIELSRNDLAMKHWLKYWILVAKTMSIAFKHLFLEGDYIKHVNA